MPPSDATRAALAGRNGSREVDHAWQCDNSPVTHTKAKTQARLKADEAWAKLWRRPVEVVFRKRRRP